MKKTSILMAFAFVLAIGSAFTIKANKATDKAFNKVSSSSCVEITECTVTNTGTTCSVQATGYPDNCPGSAISIYER